MADTDKELRSEKERVARYREELKLAEKCEQGWAKEAAAVVERYRDEQREEGSQFNILWANTEVLKPAVLSDTPRPDIRRRFRKDDSLALVVARALEQGIKWSIDSYDFDELAQDLMFDYLVPGRSVARIRYRPVLAPVEPVKLEARRAYDGGTGESRLTYLDGDEAVGDDQVEFDEAGVAFLAQPDREVVYEEVIWEYVPWKDFRHSRAKRWEDVRLVFFRHYMDRDELIESFGAMGRKVKLTKQDKDEEGRFFKVAEVWECWDKRARKMYCFSEGLPDKFLLELDDPLTLRNFFPCPRPLLAVKVTGDLRPKPEFAMYQDQADELNVLTERIHLLESALKVAGVYDSSVGDDIQKLVEGDENMLLPVDNFAHLGEKGGLRGVIDFLPIQETGQVLNQLQADRRLLLQTIFEITGISDVQRGNTDPRETATAQEFKANFGSRRLLPRQKQVQRFFREVFEITAEVMAEHFDIEMFNMILGEEMPPEAYEMMRSEFRTFRIDIETDSTIAADDQQDKQQTVEYFNAMAQLMGQFLPAAQNGFIPMAAVKAMLLHASRRFKAGREIEALIERIPEQQEGNSQAQLQQMQQAIQQLQQALQKTQEELQKARMDQSIKAAESRAEQQRKDQETAADIRRKDEAHRREQARRDAESQAKIRMLSMQRKEAASA